MTSRYEWVYTEHAWEFSVKLVFMLVCVGLFGGGGWRRAGAVIRYVYLFLMISLVGNAMSFPP